MFNALGFGGLRKFYYLESRRRPLKHSQNLHRPKMPVKVFHFFIYFTERLQHFLYCSKPDASAQVLVRFTSIVLLRQPLEFLI
jgi:hypothetical protein